MGWTAAPTSYRLANPITNMHQLPVGEMPGWDNSFWMNTELSLSNVWNAPIQIRNKKTNQELSFAADYEEVMAHLEVGSALSERWAVAIEVPYVSRSGGILDEFIDKFHTYIGSDRFRRQFYDQDTQNINITTNGVSQLNGKPERGSGNTKLKLKHWLIQWKNNFCPCGLSTSLQSKIPLENHQRGLTSGTADHSATIHLGFPLGQESALWLSSAVTRIGENALFAGWPRREWAQMYEISSALAFNKHWRLIFQARMESPFFNKQHLEIIDASATREERILNRLSSGWNGLVHWRGSQSFGLNYKSSSGSQINMLIIEDWALGNYDEVGDDLYGNNAPDVSFVLQSYLAF